LSLKSIFGRYFSWSVFTLTNIIIDTEVIYYILTIGEASHKFFHTFFGSTIVATFCAILGIPICEKVLEYWNKNLQNEKSLSKLKWLATGTKITILSSVSGAFVGAYSHILLDSFMHIDVKPLGNNLRGIISIDTLHLSCVALFLIGVVIYFLKRKSK
jgi:hypothetical protein